MLVIGNDVVISIEDFLITILNNRFLFLQLSSQQKREEIIYVLNQYKNDGISVIDVNIKKNGTLHISLKAHNKTIKINY